VPQKATAEAVRRAARRSAAHAGRRGPRPSPDDVLHADKIDTIVGFHDVTRLTTLRNSAIGYAGSLTPRHKGTVCGDDEYAPINLSYLMGHNAVRGCGALNADRSRIYVSLTSPLRRVQ
jgi:hypothetical protein